MGRSWRRKNKSKHQKKAEGDDGEKGKRKWKRTGGDNPDSNPYKMVDHGNFRMEVFYAYQGAHDLRLEKEEDENGNMISYKWVECLTDEEKEAERQRWLGAMKATLPASFRIGCDVDEHLRERLEHELEEMVGKKMEIEIAPRGGTQCQGPEEQKTEIQYVAPARKLPFVPHAYQLSLDRQTIRRNPKLSPFHDWLKVQTEAGFVTRQETVSMVPPVVLDPKPHHMILDMAAAPGSKTSQLLECVNLPSHKGDHEPVGCVVANEIDPKRAYMLTHQIRRINSPAVFITSCDARHFPLLKDPNDKASEGIFDRVLCDVPCSGDGTARKNPGVWKGWTTLNGYALHPMQLAIALRGAQLTKVGGYLCYSTCSMNPIENEAVVAALIRASEGGLELVERKSQLDGMIARPGLSTWKNLAQTLTHREIKNKQKKNNAKMQSRRKDWAEKNGEATPVDTSGEKPNENDTEAASETKPQYSGTTKFEPKSLNDETELKQMMDYAGLIEYASFGEVPSNMKRRVRASCFPPSAEEAPNLHLDRCMRIMPHDMDTGGFFVALLKKVAPLNAQAKARFDALQAELEENDNDKEKTSETVEGEAASEPKAKKAKTEDNREDKIPSNKSEPPRVVLKRDLVVGEDGKKSKTIGKDDFVPVPDEIFTPLKKYYGLDEESFKEGQFMVRASGDMKKLYFVTKTVKSQIIDKGLQEKVTVVTTGLKGFMKNSKECEVEYRVAQEAIHFIAPHMSKRKLVADVADFEKCLESSSVDIKNFSENFRDQVRKLSMGSFVVSLKGYEDDYLKKLVVVMWRCRGDALNYLVTQAEIDGLMSKLRAVKNAKEPN
jgi:16S rRNA C967 or C1407 C5-methylase (RsmB/RsmF family)